MLLLSALLIACKPQNANTNDDLQSGKDSTQQASSSYLTDSEEENSSLSEEELSGKVVALTSHDFRQKVVEVDPVNGFRYMKNVPCVIDFYANWCRPCMSFKPTYHKIAEQYKGQVIFYQIDVDKAQDICSLFGIQSIPTLLFFDKNRQPVKMVGAPSEEEFRQALEDFIAK